VLAVGDFYGKRGSLIIAGLEAGKHILTDKPVCTSLEEQRRIEALVRETGLLVMCQLDLRGHGRYITLKEIIASGRIGEIHTVTVTGQHPLNIGVRPQWYFEPDCHGGTVNGIGIHAMDLVEWATGRRITSVTSARAWNAKAADYAHFKDCAQYMLELDNGGSVLGDMSYLAPHKAGGLPNYWRITCHGLHGMAETNLQSDSVLVASDDDTSAEAVPVAPNIPHRYFGDMLARLASPTAEVDLTTDQVLRASRLALTVQQVADAGPDSFGATV